MTWAALHILCVSGRGCSRPQDSYQFASGRARQGLGLHALLIIEFAVQLTTRVAALGRLQLRCSVLQGSVLGWTGLFLGASIRAAARVWDADAGAESPWGALTAFWHRTGPHFQTK